jgi:hypothetical protein
LSRPNRPAGVTALSGFFAIGSIMALLAAASLLLPGSQLEALWRVNPRGRAALGGLGGWGALLMAMVSAACILACVGLWKGARWGYPWAVGLLVVNLLGDLLNGWLGSDRRTLVGVPIAGGILAYLARSKVREFFHAAPR